MKWFLDKKEQEKYKKDVLKNTLKEKINELIYTDIDTPYGNLNINNKTITFLLQKIILNKWPVKLNINNEKVIDIKNKEMALEILQFIDNHQEKYLQLYRNKIENENYII